MSALYVRLGLMSSVTAGFLAATTMGALAGGYAVHEQSTYAQGASFAGIAAGGSASAMFWNPATMTQLPGLNVEYSASAILTDSRHYTQPGSTLFGVLPDTHDNFAQTALLPSSYTTYQLGSDLWAGVSVNAPFGLALGFQDLTPYRNYAQNTSLRTFNATPSIAYRINDWISVGVGVQIQYAVARFSSGLTVAPVPTSLYLRGDGWGFGATAGITLTPGPNTQIGLGYRSQINQDIEGSIAIPLPGATNGAVNTTLNLPDTVSLGVRHLLTPDWRVMGTVEWTNWSRSGTSRVMQASGSPAIVAVGAPVTIPFQYDDGWFFSAGAEYLWSPKTTLRAGLAYELTPISDRVRTPRVPDSDRFWVSAGLSHEVYKNLTLDFAYSHIFVKDAAINISAVSGNPSFNGTVTYIGTARTAIDIVSVGLKYRFAPTPAPAVLYRKG